MQIGTKKIAGVIMLALDKIDLRQNLLQKKNKDIL